MAGTPRDGAPVSLLFASPSPTRGGGVEAPFTQRQPSWGPPAATPVTPGSRFLQPLQAPRSDGPATRWKNMPTPTECPTLPVASSLFSDLGAPEGRVEDTAAAPQTFPAALPAAGGLYRDGAQGGPPPDAADTWVTVFGFPPEELATVLREFQKCGEVVASGAFSAEPANWVHICYSHADEAQRALLRDGFQLTNRLIIGVKPVDPRQRAAVPELSSHALPVQLASRHAPSPALERPYRLARSQAGSAALSGVGPQSSWVGKFGRYVLGL